MDIANIQAKMMEQMGGAGGAGGMPDFSQFGAGGDDLDDLDEIDDDAEAPAAGKADAGKAKADEPVVSYSTANSADGQVEKVE